MRPPASILVFLQDALAPAATPQKPPDRFEPCRAAFTTRNSFQLLQHHCDELLLTLLNDDFVIIEVLQGCLLYTSDAADE
mgnify:CR=1 FL=1